MSERTPERTRLVYFRVSSSQEAKLERMRQRSNRPSIQNVLETLVASANEDDPIWNVVYERPSVERELRSQETL